MHRMLAVVLLLVMVPLARGEDWPMWRGPRLNGISAEEKLPLTWNAKENIAWKAVVPGVGHSSPIVHGDLVFATSCDLKTKERLLLAFDRVTGTELWRRTVVTTPLEHKHGLNSWASGTPATDGKHVWVSFLQTRAKTEADADVPIRDPIPGWKNVIPEMLVVCYSVKGEKVWEKVPGRFYAKHGFSSSVVLHKNLVIVNGDQDANGYIVALEQGTGNEKWRIERPNRTRSYCVPLIVEAAGKTQMVLGGSMCTASYDPDNGKLIWIMDGPTEQFVASPVYADGVLFLTAGFPTYHNLGIRPQGRGKIGKEFIAWHENKTSPRKAAYVPSPLGHDKWIYMMSDLGEMSCLEAKTGKRLWMEPLGRHHSGSPIYAAGHLYVTDDDGITHVLKAGADFEVVARNELGEACYSSPAAARGQIFIRTQNHLWCIGKK